jgi:hypothetical protein
MENIVNNQERNTLSVEVVKFHVWVTRIDKCYSRAYVPVAKSLCGLSEPTQESLTLPNILPIGRNT